MSELSFQTRAESLRRFESDTFDFLVIGGGITGAAVARDAAQRGLQVALVERDDFAGGTSSRSSKLIHGGLRYLENMEFGLVFEALSERALLLKTAPHLVRPLKFFLPVYQGDPHGKGILGLGLWLYDLLALFRAPGFHKNLSKKRMLEAVPFLKDDGLKGGFSYYDASMWDDALAVETLRAAAGEGAAIANYVEAVRPVEKDGRVAGFECVDRETGRAFRLRAKVTISCTGPWTDELGARFESDWKPWLATSKGVHLVFDLKRIPIPGAMVMSHPTDGRISFVIPRTDLGAGVVIVGTTDSPAPTDPARAEVSRDDVAYLLELLQRYFPTLKLGREDILSSYVGVRPLMAPPSAEGGVSLQKVSREHHIAMGSKGAVFVAGGKYTTHRKMAEEIVDFTLDAWDDGRAGVIASRPGVKPRDPHTKDPINPHLGAGETVRPEFAQLFDRYGAEAQTAAQASDEGVPAVEGFPKLAWQLEHQVHNGMVLHLDDFYLRRVPLYLARMDHGLPFAEALARVLSRARFGKVDATFVREECARLDAAVRARETF